ncbi:MAG: hypothetical protein IJY53_03955 [Akkermansia sp.]|nr:hypothetical protein [Akkermansia sp.]
MNKNDEKFTPEYSCKKAAELRYAMKVALPLVAEKAEMPLHLAEAYLSGEKVMSEKIYLRLQAAVGSANSQALPDEEIAWKNVKYPEEVAHLEYTSGKAENTAVMVRFSADEWGQVARLFPQDADIEACMRAFVLKVLDTEVKCRLYCPDKASDQGRDMKDKRAFFEDDAVRVAAEYTDDVKDRINQVLSWAGATPEEFFRRLVQESLDGSENEEGLSADESLSVRVWRARALQAEAELAELRAKLAELAGGLLAQPNGGAGVPRTGGC